MPSWRVLPDVGNTFVATYGFDTIPSGLDELYLVTIEAERFHKTRALNCAAKVAMQVDRPDYFLFIDCDIVIRDPQVFARTLQGNPLPEVVVDSPHAWQHEMVAEDPEIRDRGKRGTHLVRPELFFRLHGYDQRIIGWGLPDVNLYHRYARVTENHSVFDRRLILHLPHSDALRVRLNPQPETLGESVQRNLQVHSQQFDLYGESWREEMGYPSFSERPPG